MSQTRTNPQRSKTWLGFSCLVLSFLLWSPGVRTVRAGEDPLQASEPQTAAPLAVVPAPTDGQIEMTARAPDPRTEAAGGGGVLDTRGYNYGPDRPTSRPQAVQLPTSPEAEEK